MAKLLGLNETASIEKNFRKPDDRYSDFIDENYEFSEGFEGGNWRDPKQVKSIAEMVACLESNPDVGLDARVLAYNPETKQFGMKRVGREEFLEAYKNGDQNWQGVELREGGVDSFATDGDSGTSGLIGQDFVPLLGGPFYKNLYFYDYIKQANAAFYAYHHDPIAHQAVNIIKDFTLGRGFRVDSDNAAAMAIWKAFEKANDLQGQMDKLATEISVNGEVMVWKLPDDQAKIVQVPYANQPNPRAIIPRVRLLDATVFWEIVTVPEDITNVLYYVWVAPTQWQMYTGLQGENSLVPSTKFIFQTIPADQINHYKVNAFSNEKRGRSDLFSVLGMLKRLRDCVNYSLVSLQKQASWCIDTTIEGSQGDINAYIQDQASLGTVAPAGSEFVHSAKIKREYKGVEGTGKGGGSVTFEWALSCVAAGMGIPISYFGTHLSGGQTRASAITATEPVAKRFEARQKLYEKIIQDLWDYLMDKVGINAECEVTFPEIITADRSQKLQDLAFAENMKWFSNERVANMIAKEFNVTEYIYEEEQDKIKTDPSAPMVSNPLTAPAPKLPKQDIPDVPKPTSDITSSEKTDIKDQEYE